MHSGTRPGLALQECHRVLRSGGRMHASDSDWGFFVFEPLTPEQAAALISAAGHAFKTPLIGRKLYGLCRTIGYSEVNISVVPFTDTEGRFAGVIRNMGTYARIGGTLPEAEIEAMMAEVDTAIAEGTYLFVLPQFLVTATV